MSAFILHHGDCLEVLKTLPDDSVDSIVTDPPYGLSFMGKKWDYDVPSMDVWRECLRVLKPGGHLLSFAGSRTYHRMTIAIEDAGFEIRDQIMWVYGSGFPKSLDVSKAIDKAAGAVREVIGYSQGRSGSVHGGGQSVGVPDPITAPATDAARQWQGWGTALKPSHEPICVARKPLGTCATNVLQMVESQLRERGVRGEILWKPENASGAARSKKTTSSGSTRPSEQSGTSAKTADESAMQSAEQQSLKSSGQLGTNGQNQTPDGSASFQGCTTSAFENPSSLLTAASANAAESVSATSSPLTTSTAEGHGTGSKFTGRFTLNCGAKDSRPDTESFAGIATGLTGSMGTVHISRDSEGFFLWPKGLPEFVPGSPLTVAENVLAHGTGAINVDGCRVWTDDGANRARPPRTANAILGGGRGTNLTASEHNDAGRWPANLIHDGSEEVVGLFPQSVGVVGARREGGDKGIFSGGGHQQASKQKIVGGVKDSDSAARFFYCAKASKKDRNDGCQGVMTWENVDLQSAQMVVQQLQEATSDISILLQDGCEWSTILFGNEQTARFLPAIKCIIEMATKQTTHSATSNCSVPLNTNDFIRAAIETMKVCGSSPADFAEYTNPSKLNTTCEKTESAAAAVHAVFKMLCDANESAKVGNVHSTVKPTELMRYLCRLVTPPGGVVLDPFMGSGSTGKAAVLEGFRFIGIEREAEYLEIARARIEAVMRQPELIA